MRIILLLFFVLVLTPTKAEEHYIGLPPKGFSARKFHHALEKGNVKQMRRIVKRKLRQFHRTRKFHPETSATGRLVDWLGKQTNLSRIVGDSCGTHIAIWPGWTDIVLISNKMLGYQNYRITIQHGRSWRYLYFLRRYDEKSILKHFLKDDGSMLKSFEYSCEIEAQNDRHIANDTKLRYSLDLGRLTWSVVNSPGFLDSDKELLRFKVVLENHHHDTLKLKWPIHQNTGRKLLTVSLYDRDRRITYYESDSLNMVIRSSMVGHETLTLAPGERREFWHSVNDKLHYDSDVKANHVFPGLPIGNYDVRVCYQPFLVGEDPGEFWKPSVDSTSAYIGYPWYYTVNDEIDTFSVVGKVLGGSEPYTTNYGFQNSYIGLVEITNADSAHADLIGKTIAWKFKTFPFSGQSRPISLFKYQQPGNYIRLTLDGNLPRESISSASGSFTLFGLFEGYRSIKEVYPPKK